jgi:hypothetical protein
MRRALQRLRGIVGTALVWAGPWAIVGALVTLVATVIPPGGSAWLRSPAALLSVAGASAKTFGILGALCGAACAGTLALLGRRVTLAELHTATVLEAGAIGGALVPLTVFAARTVLIGPARSDAYLAILLSTALGAGSAWLMLRIARRAIEHNAPSQLAAPAAAFDLSTARERVAERRPTT